MNKDANEITVNTNATELKEDDKEQSSIPVNELENVTGGKLEHLNPGRTITP